MNARGRGRGDGRGPFGGAPRRGCSARWRKDVRRSGGKRSSWRRGDERIPGAGSATGPGASPAGASPGGRCGDGEGRVKVPRGEARRTKTGQRS